MPSCSFLTFGGESRLLDAVNASATMNFCAVRGSSVRAFLLRNHPSMSDELPAISLPKPKPKARTSARKRSTAWFPLRVDPTELTNKPELEWHEEWLQWFRSGWKGILVSVAVHVAVLTGLAMIVIQQVRRTDSQALESGWFIPDPAGSTNGTKGLTPIRIEAAKDASAAAGKPVEKPSENPGGAPPPRGVGPEVKAMSPAGMLGGRGTGKGDGDGKGVGAVSGGGGRFGGDARVEASIKAGLGWLARQQQSGGNWKLHEGYPDAGRRTSRTDTGATGLALMAFLGAGHTHTDGGQYASNIRKGLDWLKQIQKADGDYHDHDEMGRETAFYAHSFALIAMCEALALTGDDALRESARQGVKYLLDSQQPNDGGWKFRHQNTDTVADLAVTGWALMALHTARSAGLGVPDDSYMRGSRFLDLVQVQDGARYRFAPNYPEDRFGPAMTAEGIFSRQYLCWPKDHPAMQDALAYLQEDENLPSWTEGHRNIYAWHFIGESLHNVGGKEWTEWYGRVARQIVENQTKGGPIKPPSDIRGSWNVKPLGEDFDFSDKWGRLYVTSMCLLTLETPLRHSPVYPPEGTEKSE